MDEKIHRLLQEGSRFRTTQWSLILAAGGKESPEALEALERLCRAYWSPLYAFIRRRGYTCHEAEDLTQAFFASLLERKSLADIRREGGRFRSYLLTALRHFLTNEWERARTQKRGGRHFHLSIDRDDEETRYKLELTDPITPEDLFERRWAFALLDRVLERLRVEQVASGKSAVFDQLQVFLSGDKRMIPYAKIAAALDLSEGAVKVAVHRLRKRYGELLRDEVAQTVATTEDVADELRHLRTIMSR